MLEGEWHLEVVLVEPREAVQRDALLVANKEKLCQQACQNKVVVGHARRALGPINLNTTINFFYSSNSNFCLTNGKKNFFFACFPSSNLSFGL